MFKDKHATRSRTHLSNRLVSADCNLLMPVRCVLFVHHPIAGRSSQVRSKRQINARQPFNADMETLQVRLAKNLSANTIANYNVIHKSLASFKQGLLARATRLCSHNRSVGRHQFRFDGLWFTGWRSGRNERFLLWTSITHCLRKSAKI